VVLSVSHNAQCDFLQSNYDSQEPSLVTSAEGMTCLPRLAALIHIKSLLLNTLRPSTKRTTATGWKFGLWTKLCWYDNSNEGK